MSGSGGGGTTSDHDPRVELLHKILDETARLVLAQLPVLKSAFWNVMDAVFVPKQVARQLLLLIALETGLVTLNQVTALARAVASKFSANGSRRQVITALRERQLTAETQDEWMELAKQIDAAQGNDVWRTDPACALYERDRIQARIDEFVHLMRRNDIFELMFVLRGSIGRNKFGLLHEGLFSKAQAGTKVLVESYHSVVCAALDFVCDGAEAAGEDPIPVSARLAFFNETRHSYGRTALLLSGGAALGHYHAGVVKCLMENGLMPRVLGGSSAGSILCAMVGTRTDEECMQEFFAGRGTDGPGHFGRLRLDFFRPLVLSSLHSGANNDSGSNAAAGQRQQQQSPTNVFVKVYRNTAGAFHDAKRTIVAFMPLTLRRASSVVYDILAGNRRAADVFKNDTLHFRECVRNNVGNFTFQEAFDRTGRILNIVVTPNNASDPPRLLNYLTAPHVLVWSAAVASSSLPGVFEANRLVVKEADGWERYEASGGTEQRFSDGSMEQDLPMEQLSEMFNVNHFVISQANPHAVMFASYGSHSSTSVWTNPVTGLLHSILRFLRDQVRSWLQHLVQLVGTRRIAPLFETQRGIGTQFFTQEYEGRKTDVSLIPWFGHRSMFSALLHIIYNPEVPEWLEWLRAAERETWRHIPAIRSHCAEEMTLDRCVQRLRRRLLEESWGRGAGGGGQKNDTMSRVPSFFHSQSHLNLTGGLAVSDQQVPKPVVIQHEYENEYYDGGDGTGGIIGQESKSSAPDLAATAAAAAAAATAVSQPALQQDVSSANTGNLHDNDRHHQQQRQQHAGERTNDEEKKMSTGSLSGAAPGGDSNNNDGGAKRSDSTNSLPGGGYIKTTCMANFYYRRTDEYRNAAAAADGLGLRKTTSDPFLATANKRRGGAAAAGADSAAAAAVVGNGGGSLTAEDKRQQQQQADDGGHHHHHRRKSRSHADLQATASRLQ